MLFVIEGCEKEKSVTGPTASTAPLSSNINEFVSFGAIQSGNICDETCKCSKCPDDTCICGNCVLFVRKCRVPSLPYGLWTYEDKKRIINSYTPTIGAVAIMNIYLPWGHVAYVKSWQKDKKGNVTSITVEESNFKKCKVGSRTGTPSSMKVTGYYKP